MKAMKEGYFASSWGDLTTTPQWFSKLALLALLQLIPIFGQIVLMGYAFGWARDIAWGYKTKLPDHIFGNEDGRLYSRGFFTFLYTFLFGIMIVGVLAIPALFFLMIGSAIGGGALMFLGALILLALLIAWLLLCIFGQVFVNLAQVRIALYNTLTAGFRFKQIFAMMKADFKGVWCLVGLMIVLSFVSGFCSWFTMIMFDGLSNLVIYNILGPNGVAVSMILSLLTIWVVSLFGVGVTLIEARAVGYFVGQFEVNHWKGESEPIPAECFAGSANAAACSYPVNMTEPQESAASMNPADAAPRTEVTSEGFGAEATLQTLGAEAVPDVPAGSEVLPATDSETPAPEQASEPEIDMSETAPADTKEPIEGKSCSCVVEVAEEGEPEEVSDETEDEATGEEVNQNKSESPTEK